VVVAVPKPQDRRLVGIALAQSQHYLISNKRKNFFLN